MSALLTISRTLSVVPIIDIRNQDFARWYSSGVFWALYGDEQGHGPQTDTYLITNITHAVRAGWYDHLDSGHLQPSGFYLGMVHGGMLTPGTHCVRPVDTIVTLTNAAFKNGYQASRHTPFAATDGLLTTALHTFRRYSDREIAYELGTLIGTLY
jgi:hypothetical protein